MYETKTFFLFWTDMYHECLKKRIFFHREPTYVTIGHKVTSTKTGEKIVKKTTFFCPNSSSQTQLKTKKTFFIVSWDKWLQQLQINFLFFCFCFQFFCSEKINLQKFLSEFFPFGGKSVVLRRENNKKLLNFNIVRVLFLLNVWIIFNLIHNN